MRKRARVDDNQRQIVEALTAAGWKIASLAPLGQGVPDLLATRHGELRLFEVKCAKGKLTTAQQQFFSQWPVTVLRTVTEALAQ